MASAVIVSQHESDGTSASNDSKKRNKLGYHRTAVACGHCRRRKIRCISSADTTETRCQNCIRLKKDCQFYPVDQNVTSARKSRSNSKADASMNEPVAQASSPSPCIGTSTIPEYEPAVSSAPGATVIWAEGTGFVTSSAEQAGSLPSFDPTSWSATGHGNLPSMYTRHNSHPGPAAGAFWLPNDHSGTMAYQQPVYTVTTCGSFVQDAQLAYSSPPLHETRHNSDTQSLNGMPSMAANSYRHYSGLFPDIERSITMPELYSQSISAAEPASSMHSSPHLGVGHGQYSLPPAFSPQFAHRNPSPWMHHSPPQTYPTSFLPSQKDKNQKIVNFTT